MDREMGTGNQNMAVVKGASRVLLLPISMSPAAPKVGLLVSILFHHHSTTPSISGGGRCANADKIFFSSTKKATRTEKLFRLEK